MPGSDEYQIGSPSVKNATLNLENGKSFEIEAKNQSDKNVYIEKIELNGKVIKDFTIKHQDIMNGGKLTFYMTNKPKK